MDMNCAGGSLGLVGNIWTRRFRGRHQLVDLKHEIIQRKKREMRKRTTPQGEGGSGVVDSEPVLGGSQGIGPPTRRFFERAIPAALLLLAQANKPPTRRPSIAAPPPASALSPPKTASPPLAAENIPHPAPRVSSCFSRPNQHTHRRANCAPSNSDTTKSQAHLDSSQRRAARPPTWISTSRWTSMTSRTPPSPQFPSHTPTTSSQERNRFELATLSRPAQPQPLT